MPAFAPLILAAATAASALTYPIVNNDGKNIGNATFEQGSKGVVLEVTATGLTPGHHGMHLHEVGDCSDGKDGFKKSGGHINPDHTEHGLLNAKGPHPSDLPNLYVNEDGTADSSFLLGMLSMDGEKNMPALLDKDGSALIIHANPDDYKTQPIGGAGDRVACAAVKK